MTRPPRRKITRPHIQFGFFSRAHGDNQPFDGKSNILAHTYFPGEISDTSYNGKVHFDKAEPWTLDKGSWVGNDLFLVATHEIGHSLGLGHSDSSNKNIMYSAYQSVNTVEFRLSEDDINGITSLYGINENKKGFSKLFPKGTSREILRPTRNKPEIEPTDSSLSNEPKKRHKDKSRLGAIIIALQYIAAIFHAIF